MTRKSNVRKITKLQRSVKAISPVIATLLMIAIAVVASLVAYAFVMGYMGTTTSKVGKAIQLPSFASQAGSAAGPLVVYVQNVGQGTVELKPEGSVYVDDVLYPITNPTDNPITIPEGQTVALTIGGYTYTPGTRIKIRVTTSEGTFMETVGKSAGSQGGGQPLPQYTLTVNPSAQGHVNKSPDQAQYTSGVSVMLTAVADADGYTFQSWSGDVPAPDVNSNPVTIIMDGNKTVTPSFVLSQETLNTYITGTGAGAIDRDVNPPYSYGTVVHLTAVPADSSTFGGWSGDGVTDGGNPLVREVTLNSDQSVNASFTIKTFTITPSVSGTGGGSITPNTPQIVNYDSTPTFNFQANLDYHISDVTVDSVSQGVLDSYIFAPVHDVHTIEASFAPDTEQFAVTFDFNVLGGGSPTAPTVDYVDLGVPKTVTAGPSATVNVDSGTTYTYINPLSGSGSSERWQTTQNTGTISAADTVNPTYYRQFQIIVTASPATTPPLGGSFTVSYTKFGSTTTPSQNTQWQDWADVSSTVTVSNWQTPVGSYAYSSITNNGATMNSAQTITLNYNIPLPALYVTSENDLHTPTDVGSLGSFANMQNDAASYSTLTEANTGGGSGSFGSSTGTSNTVYSSGEMRGSVWTSPADAEGATIQSMVWYGRRDSSSGSSNAKALLVRHSDLTIIAISDPVTVTSTAQEYTCTFSSPPTISANTQYVLMVVFNADTRLYRADGSNNQGHGDDSNSYSLPINPTDAGHNDYAYRIRANYNKPNNYQLDSEVQFSGVTNYASYTRLEIKTGAFSGENIEAYRWSGSAWVLLGTLTQNAVNTYTVALTGATFDLRFYDTTRTSDTTQDTWQIDYVRLVVP